MKKLVAVFLLAVLIPSLILAWLAVRSLRDQEIVVERQSALLHQATTESIAGDVNVFMDDIRVYFRNLVDELVAERGTDYVSSNFDALVCSRWAQAEVCAVVSDEGILVSPERASNEPRIQAFNDLNADFLSNLAAEEVYQAAPQIANTIAIDVEKAADVKKEEKVSTAAWGRVMVRKPDAVEGAKEKVSIDNSKLRSSVPEKRQAYQNRDVQPADQKARSIVPLSQAEIIEVNEEDLELNANPWSNLVTQKGEFRELMGEDEEGVFSRFLQNRLHVLLWYRPRELSGRVFCAQLDLATLKEELGRIIVESHAGRSKEICVALIDETGNVVSRSIPDFMTNWRNPFVASEIGEILPHWEVAAYLVNPESLNRIASSFRFTLGLMVFVLIAAIGFGSLLIFLDLARQTKLARQKTDFVSNVSHELKTPLTSIRMFSDLLGENSIASGEKRLEYAGIISSEAARLTRLINNLLDFSRLERGDKKIEHERLDLTSLVKETMDHYRDHLRSKGVTLAFDPGQGAGIEIKGDRDALSQVLLNLVSNAEKYGGDAKEIKVEIVPVDGKAEVRVMDRGEGVARKHQERIFKKFYRIDDSLSSGIQGSGLGLALARQIARAHGGDVVYRNRKGGGSCFVIVIPVAGAAAKRNGTW